MKKNIIIIAVVSFIAGFATSCYISKKLDEVEDFDEDCFDEDYDGPCPCCGYCESEGDAISPKPEAKAGETKAEAKAEETKAEAKAEETKAEAKAEETKAEAKAEETKAEAKAEESKVEDEKA